MMAKDRPEAYLDVFEAMAISAQWPQEQEAAARTLSLAWMMDYPTLKVASLTRVGATPEGFRRKFREKIFSAQEHPWTIAHRLEDYAMGWLNPDATTKARLVEIIMVDPRCAAMYPNFKINLDLLYHVEKLPQMGEVRHQLLILLPFKEDLLQLAQAIPLSGHLGRDKTKVRLVTRFYWLGLDGDVQRFCECCRECQLASPRAVPWAPPLPTMISFSCQANYHAHAENNVQNRSERKKDNKTQ
ncbi:UNVERIFIED_CONTAM: hypothetical protein FKN15_010209 [Acipenser sinensis]